MVDHHGLADLYHMVVSEISKACDRSYAVQDDVFRVVQRVKIPNDIVALASAENEVIRAHAADQKVVASVVIKLIPTVAAVGAVIATNDHVGTGTSLNLVKPVAAINPVLSTAANDAVVAMIPDQAIDAVVTDHYIIACAAIDTVIAVNAIQTVMPVAREPVVVTTIATNNIFTNKA